MLHRAGLLVLLAALGGCVVSRPAFRAELPREIAPGTGRIAVVGDLQMTPVLVRKFRGREDNRAEQRQLVADLTARLDDIGALVIVGDLVYTSESRHQWRHFDSLVAPIAARVPVLPAIGNHDYHCPLIQICTQRVVPRRFRKRFPWMAPGTPYAVERGDLLLVFLDSETGFERQSVWLEATLDDAAERFAAALVFFHRPPYSNSIDRGAVGNEDTRRYFARVIEQAPLPAVVVNGHIHGYEHLAVNGVTYITSAGGGGPRGLLGPERPLDVYSGRDCRSETDGSVLRPFNYLLVDRQPDAIEIEVRGLCRGDAAVGRLESVRVPL